MTTVLVVGGGPAGLAAAIHAAEAGASVHLHERNGQCGVKLLATGGGRCNAGNLRPVAEWPALFGKRGRFILPAMDFLPLDRLRAWLSEMGVVLSSPDGFHLFPVDNSAKTVRDALVKRAEAAGVVFHRESRVERLAVAGDVVQGVVSAGRNCPADRMIVCAGGRSYPATGSTGDGLALAADAGHDVTPTYPGLVGLRADALGPDLAGLVMADAEVAFKARGKPKRTGRGELLLTHTGVSGPAVLDLSGEAAEALAVGDGAGGPAFSVRWIAGLDEAAWERELASWRGGAGGTPLLKLLRRDLPARLARRLLEIAGCGADATPAALRADARNALVRALGAFPLRVAATEGWERAMITRGGVALGGVCPGTLESRVVSGLFFAGEVLDVDGPCGGYNLHWAFASGALAGASAARPEKGC